jgi:hypothetical protein
MIGLFMLSTHYDVFVSYSRRDAYLARDVASGLEAAGFRVWFDEEQIQPGALWIDEISRGVQESHATVMLIGEEGVGRWTSAEGRQALREAVERHHRVIPVLLPTASNEASAVTALPLLTQYHFVNCRELPLSKHIVERVAVALTGRKLVAHMTQVGQEFPLTLIRPDNSRRIISVFTLPNAQPDSLLWLTWDTFGACTERLAQQISNYGWRINADACIGINDAGLVMATFLGSAVLERPKLGYLRCRGTGTQRDASYFLDGCFLPELHDNPTILLVDFELKTGKGLGEIRARLGQQYRDPRLYFAVCGALVRSPNLVIENIEELEAHAHLRDSEIVDLFIAATMSSPGIEPPLGLR